MITSLQNTRIKNIIKLGKAKERKEQNLIVVEGARELSLALTANYTIESLYICQELFSKSDYPRVLDSIPLDIQYEVNLPVFEKMAYREGSDGIIALAIPKPHTLQDLDLKKDPFIIIVEAIEKPGNLGAILRTADAAKVDAVIVCDPQTDVYNPNTIRSSVGCIFTVPLAICTSIEAMHWLTKNDIASYSAELNASVWYHTVDYKKASAIIMGTEADGLSQFWLENTTQRIKIPMKGKIDSLNVSVSTAIITFEAMRQRGFM